MWMIAAVCSAVFAGLTAILAKCGIRKTGSDLVTALRTAVVLLFSVGMVFLVGSQNTLADISPRSWLFLILSGLATGASWICYFKALSLGDVNKVAPIDKSSTILSVLLAILLFGETNYLAVKLTGTTLIGVGTYLMLEKTPTGQTDKGTGWLPYAVLSAVFAALTSVLAKVGVAGVESNLATAIRTGVVLVLAWGIVFARGEHQALRTMDRRELGFIVQSGLATGWSWLCYYYALQNGAMSVVVPVDKMSILLTVAFSRVFLKERLTPRAALGLAFLCAGTLAMAVWA